jgi:hypothetical protein
MLVKLKKLIANMQYLITVGLIPRCLQRNIVMFYIFKVLEGRHNNSRKHYKYQSPRGTTYLSIRYPVAYCGKNSLTGVFISHFFESVPRPQPELRIKPKL